MIFEKVGIQAVHRVMHKRFAPAFPGILDDRSLDYTVNLFNNIELNQPVEAGGFIFDGIQFMGMQTVSILDVPLPFVIKLNCRVVMADCLSP